MKKVHAILLLIIFFLSNGKIMCNNPEIHCYYQHNKFVVDGENDDWGDMAFYDEKMSIVSDISNDHENIYIKIRVTDYVALNRLFLGGLTVWFNEDGKTKKKVGISFPLAEEMSLEFKTQFTRQDGMSEEMIKKLQTQRINKINVKFSLGLAAINVLDEDYKVIQHFSVSKNDTGLSATIKMIDFDLLEYEARIPLDLVFKNKEEFLQSKGKSFCMGFEYGKFEIEEIKEQQRQEPIHNRYGRYTYDHSQQQNYGKAQPVFSWYKNVYLAHE